MPETVPPRAPEAKRKGRRVVRLTSVHEGFSQVVHELAKFGIIGAIAFVIDVGTYNVLRLGPLEDRPTTAKIISAAISIAFAYVGNRFWTYRHRPRTGYARETALFLVFNILGLCIALLCQAFTHYVLGLDSLLADNLSANGLGLVLGTAFRFWSYRKFVFPRVPEDAPLADDPLTPAP
jgi:putative flippase GtrA